MGVGVLVLLVVVLSVSGVVAYRYKEKQRERMRRCVKVATSVARHLCKVIWGILVLYPVAGSL